MEPFTDMVPSLWVNETIKIAGLGLVAYLSGLLVQYRSVRVNYTRKVNFFALFLVPLLVDYLLPYKASQVGAVVHRFLFMGLLLAFVRPIRERLPFAATMFSSYDRPEDRPFTLLWLVTQLLAGYLVIVPMSICFGRMGLSQLMFIPVLVHGLGDGLAEPVGVRFGKHHYATRALFCDRRYTRSIEGSACVFVVGVLALVLFHLSFSPVQFVVSLLLLPIAMTLAEAVSPHTCDTPLMLLAGCLTLLAAVRLF
jgi:dolichol kinase